MSHLVLMIIVLGCYGTQAKDADSEYMWCLSF